MPNGLAALFNCFAPQDNYQALPPPPTLVRLVVIGATETDNRWWASARAGRRVVVRAITAPNDDAAEWAQIVWGPGGTAIVGHDNCRAVSRGAVAAGTVVSAGLGGVNRQVSVDIVDLTGIATDLPIGPANQGPGHDRWKGYISRHHRVAVEAQVNPNDDATKSLVRWNVGNGLFDGDMRVRDHKEQRRIARTAAGDTTVIATLGEKTWTADLHICLWPRLRLEDVTFSGAHRHDVENDTLGNLNPVWQRTGAKNPICYTRNNNVSLTATFSVTTQPTDNENVNLRATANFGGTVLTWTANGVAVANNANQIVFPVTASDVALPDAVGCYDPVTITWEMSNWAGAPNAWLPIGTSQHTFYATLGDPNGTPAYWTLLDVSCRAAHGQNNAAGLVGAVFAPFQNVPNPGIQRKRDRSPLSYWNPRDVARNVPSTQDLLACPQATGHCGSWASMLIDLYKVHGVTTGQKIYVAHQSYVPQVLSGVPQAAPINQNGMLVKNWTFNAMPAQQNNVFTHLKGTTVRQRPPGIAAQRNPTPPPRFWNHFIVYSTTTNRFYDPSYGAGPFNDPDGWEAAAIDGLDRAQTNVGRDDAAGRNGYVRLLHYYNLVTGLAIP